MDDEKTSESMEENIEEAEYPVSFKKLEENAEETTRKSEEYYIAAFKKLEDSGENTWNWAAFFFGSAWFVYRKMFWRGVLFEILERVCCVPLFLLDRKNPDDMGLLIMIIALVVGIIFWLIPRVLLGNIGNAIYYERIKDRISDGYHICEKYRPTSILSIFTLPAPFVWIRDKLLLRDAMKKCNSSFDDDFNEKNIRAVI